MFHWTLRPKRRLARFSKSIAGIVTIQLLLMGLSAAPALAQLSGTNPGIGFPPLESFAGSEFDTVNEGNLNIHFSIPVFQKSGRGLSVVATISYNSLIWTPVGALTDGNGNPISSAQWVPPAVAPWGFTLSPFTSYVTYTRRVVATCPNGNKVWQRSNYTFHAPDGTGHSFGAAGAVEADCNGTPHGFGPVMAQDDSGYSLSVNSGMGDFVTNAGGDLSTPSQLEVFGNSIPSSMSFEVPAGLIDTNGNVLGFSGNALIDTLGTQAMQYSGTSTSASFTYPSPPNPATFVGVKLNYTTYTVQTAFNCGWPEYGPTNQLGPTTAQLVTSIQMPDGSSYSFTYEPTPGAPANTTGRLTSVTLPTGATINYTLGAVDCSDGSTRKLTRVTPDGTWTYTRQITETAFSNGQHGQITSSITTVTDPLGNASVINFGVGDQFESKRQIYTGTSTLLETIETCYNGAAFPCTSTANNPTITQRTVRRELPDTTGKVSETDTHVNAAGLTTDVFEYDFGSGSPGALVRHTATTYNTLTANIFYQPTASYASPIYNRPATVTVTDVSNNVQSQTSYFYDETTPTSTSGTPSQVQVTGSRGNLTTVKELVSGTTTIQKTTTYFDTGTVRTDSDFQSPPNITTYGYGTNSCGNSFPTTVTNPLWLEKTTVWDCNGGVATSITDQNNQVTSYKYGDANYWRLTEIDFPDGGQVTTTYNLGTNRPWNTIQTTKQTSTQNIVKKTIYDSLARVSQQQLTSDPENPDLTDTTYDAAGHVHSVSNPYRSTSDSTYGLTSYTYDGMGRITKQTEPDGSSTQSAYSANCTTVTDETGKSRESCVDGLGRMTQVFEDPGSSPHLNYETDYAYYPLGNLLTVTQKGGTTDSTQWRTRNFTYDSLSRLLTANNPESGTIQYTYDNNGNVLTKTAPSPNQPATGIATVTTTYTYDQLNRLKGKSYADSYTSNPATAPVDYAYDGNSLPSCPAQPPPGDTDPYPVGHRSSMCDFSGATNWTHDKMGRINQEKRTIGAAAGKVDTDVYNFDGSVASMTVLGFNVTYTYNAAGRPLTAVNPGTTNTNYVSNAMYAPFGGLTSATYGAGTTSIAVTNSYNKRLQPIFISAAAASPILSLCYDFHSATAINSAPCSFAVNSTGDNGNVFQIVNNRDGNRTQNFLYDSLNRISQGYSSGTNWGETFGPTATAPGTQPTSSGIDAWGNLTNRSGVTGKTLTEGLSVSATVKNQLNGFGYDAAGNMISNGSATYVYNAENQLIATGGLSYKYDGDGKRVEKCTEATPGTCTSNATATKYWMGWTDNVSAETDLPGNVIANYVFFNGQRIARRDTSTGKVHYYFSDYLGTHSLVTDANGTMPPQKESDYFPYGGEIPITSGDTNHYRFTGKERDSESGLDNFGARYDASSSGRFMTPDWAAKPTTVPYAMFGDPQTLNLYAYVRNNPVSHADADGHCADHYKDGTCKVNVDPKTGDAGAKAGKQLEGVLNKYDKAVNALNDKDKFNIKDSKGKVIGSMTGKEIKAVWNGTSFEVTNKSFNNGGAGGGTGGTWNGDSFSGHSQLNPGAVSAYANAASDRNEAPLVGLSTLTFHELSHETHFGEGLTQQYPVTPTISWPREQGTSSAGNRMSQAAGAPFDCSIPGGCE